MAILETPGGTRLPLEATHTVGRSSYCLLRVADTRVSGQHAVLAYARGSWTIKDLASRNGTFVHGQRLAPGAPHPLALGAAIRLGAPDADAFVLRDAAPPEVCALPDRDRPVARLSEGVLAIPDGERPEVAIFHGGARGWLLERAGDVQPVESGAVFAAAGTRWTLHVPSISEQTLTAEHRSLGPHVSELALHFLVSRDEEHVRVLARCAGSEYDLGSRAHNYLWLTLARRLLADREAGLTAAACGWVHQEDLCRMLRTDNEQANLHVFRIRKQLGGLGIADAASAIERRRDSRELRLGVSDVHVRRT